MAKPKGPIPEYVQNIKKSVSYFGGDKAKGFIKKGWQYGKSKAIQVKESSRLKRIGTKLTKAKDFVIRVGGGGQHKYAKGQWLKQRLDPGIRSRLKYAGAKIATAAKSPGGKGAGGIGLVALGAVGIDAWQRSRDIPGNEALTSDYYYKHKKRATTGMGARGFDTYSGTVYRKLKKAADRGLGTSHLTSDKVSPPAQQKVVEKKVGTLNIKKEEPSSWENKPGTDTQKKITGQDEFKITQGPKKKRKKKAFLFGGITIYPTGKTY